MVVNEKFNDNQIIILEKIKNENIFFILEKY